MIYPPYQVAILSTNYFLWLGLKHALPYMVCPNPAIQWLNKDNDESVFQLREIILHDDKEAKWRSLLSITGYRKYSNFCRRNAPAFSAINSRSEHWASSLISLSSVGPYAKNHR